MARVMNAKEMAKYEEVSRRLDGHDEVLKSLQASLSELTKGIKLLLSVHSKNETKGSGADTSFMLDNEEDEENMKVLEEVVVNSSLATGNSGYKVEELREKFVEGVVSKPLFELRNPKQSAPIVMEAVNKPGNISDKGLTDLVTDTDKMSEATILSVVRKNFPDHLILGEEGGVIGDSSSDYLWCIDPMDGTTNFAHGYPSFAVFVGVLFRGKPGAAAVVEFVGGAMCWNTRTFSAVAGGGAFCNGQKIHVSQTNKVKRSLLVTGIGYEHDDPWATNMNLFKEFIDIDTGQGLLKKEIVVEISSF